VKFSLIEAKKTEFSVAAMCDWLEVSRSGYYAWLERSEQPCRRAQTDAMLKVEIRALFRQHRRRYGSPRIHRAMRAAGRRLSRKRVERLMRSDGLQARRKSRFIITTDSRGTKAPATNKLNRKFAVGRRRRAMVGDVTYVPTRSGWLYLAVLLDLGSRRVIGWATSSANDTALAMKALRSALLLRRERRRMLHHTDRGTPYASLQYQRYMRQHGLIPSMSRKGDCWDNAVAESFFATLKLELDISPLGFSTHAEATANIAEYIDGYYNTDRLHSSLGYMSPVAYEARRA